MLSKRNNGKVEDPAQIITELLNKWEIKWYKKQKIKTVERITLKLKKTSKEKEYIKKLLKDYKTWLGPFTSGELITGIKLRSEKENFIVRPKMT